MPHSMRMHITEDFTPVLEVTTMRDEANNVLTVTDSAKDSLPKKLIVEVEATHSGINRNKVEYTAFGLEASTDSWTNNYEKPVLLNHDTHSDPLGRVKAAKYAQSVIDASKQCIRLTLEITNAAAIERFLDGRYKTFSIGGYTDSAKCSICGKDQITDGWCGHSRGKKYDGKEAYWTLGKMEYDEISVVNTPADVHAQAIDIKIVANEPAAEKDATEVGEETATTQDSVEETVTIKDGADAGILESIDAVLGNLNSKDNAESTEVIKEEDEVEESSAEQGVADDVTIENVTDEVQQLTDEITQLKASIEERDRKIVALEMDMVVLGEQVDSLKEAVETEKAKAEMSQRDNEALVSQNVEYAKFAHKVLCEKVADMQIIVGEKTAEERDTLVTEYTACTTKQLYDMSNELINKNNEVKVAERAQVTNPAQVTDGTEEPESTATKTTKTLDDYEDAIARYFRTRL